MAQEDARRDSNRTPGLLVHDETGAETRRLNLTANSGIPVDVVGGSTAGTQYAAGDSLAGGTTGTAIIFKNDSDNAQDVSTSTPLPVRPLNASGTDLDMNSGNASGATQRVVLADDQPSVPVNQLPQTSGGLSLFRSIDLDETEEEVKGTAGQIYGLWFTNTATTTRFLKFYNATAANVTVGTTTPVLTLGLPGNASDDISGVFSTAMGVEFTTAITVAATTGIADADTGAPGANEVIVNIFYK